MATYDSAAVFIESQTTLLAKVNSIELIIDALLITAAKAATNDNITEYSLNDGQTIIKTVYKGVDAITRSILEFEKLKHIYLNRLNGRMVRLMDSKNFR